MHRRKNVKLQPGVERGEEKCLPSIALPVVHPLFDGLTASTVLLLTVGGVLYTIGVAFHLWERLRFHNAIWHAVVVVAAGFHYCAVLFGVVLASAD